MRKRDGERRRAPLRRAQSLHAFIHHKSIRIYTICCGTIWRQLIRISKRAARFQLVQELPIPSGQTRKVA
jgi:hypothetical protein